MPTACIWEQQEFSYSQFSLAPWSCLPRGESHGRTLDSWHRSPRPGPAPLSWRLYKGSVGRSCLTHLTSQSPGEPLAYSTRSSLQIYSVPACG